MAVELEEFNSIIQRLDSNDESLIAIDWSSKNITEAQLDVLCQSLQKPNNVGFLKLSHNNISSEGLSKISAVLQHKNNKIQYLDLGSNNIGYQGAEHISTALQHENNKLEYLDLGFNNIGPLGAKHISTALKHKNNKLGGLVLISNNILPQGTEHISIALEHENNKLEYLHLGSNNIGDEGARSISIALKHENNNLEEVNLIHNKIGFLGAGSISTALKDKNNKVTHLDLSMNEIRNEGARSISIAIMHEYNKVRNLNIGYNNIGVAGYIKICSSLNHENNKLTALNLEYNNSISSTKDHYIIDALQQNTSITYCKYKLYDILTTTRILKKLTKRNKELPSSISEELLNLFNQYKENQNIDLSGFLRTPITTDEVSEKTLQQRMIANEHHPQRCLEVLEKFIESNPTESDRETIKKFFNKLTKDSSYGRKLLLKANAVFNENDPSEEKETDSLSTNKVQLSTILSSVGIDDYFKDIGVSRSLTSSKNSPPITKVLNEDVSKLILDYVGREK